MALKYPADGLLHEAITLFDAFIRATVLVEMARPGTLDTVSMWLSENEYFKELAPEYQDSFMELLVDRHYRLTGQILDYPSAFNVNVEDFTVGEPH